MLTWSNSRVLLHMQQFYALNFIFNSIVIDANKHSTCMQLENFKRPMAIYCIVRIKRPRFGDIAGVGARHVLTQ